MMLRVPCTELDGSVSVWAAVLPENNVNSLSAIVALALRFANTCATAGDQVPGVPAIVQTQIVAELSTIMSPSWKVPATGGPLTLSAPTSRVVPEVAPVRAAATTPK